MAEVTTEISPGSEAARSTAISTSQGSLPQCDTSRFYRQVLHILGDAELPFMVGGAFALQHFTGIERDTKDLDLFIRRDDFPRAEALLRAAGFETEMTFPHWLGKVRQGDAFIDLIFNSGNGVAPVDDEWFRHAPTSSVLGVPVRVHPAEEMLWSKAFIMERERYDGADVAHLIKACAGKLDWERLMRRFDPHWRVLLSHLVLFGFIYPDRQSDIPGWVLAHLLDRARLDVQEPDDGPGHVCQGTLLSRAQYLDDLGQDGYADSRLEAPGYMSESEIAVWTRAIADKT